MDLETTSDLPVFRYHPEPLRSGSIVTSAAACRCCGQTRGFVYAGPVYAEEELSEALCPWCLADGAAHQKFDATFVDSEAFAENAPTGVMAEIVERTPGFNTWQSERWLSCCGQPAAFLTPAGMVVIRQHYPRLEGSLMMHIVHELGLSGGAARQTLAALHRDRSPTAYIFKCLHCEGMPVYVDGL
jgi:uncharacterized protein CbrC (UPF0167 family)